MAFVAPAQMRCGVTECIPWGMGLLMGYLLVVAKRRERERNRDCAHTHRERADIQPSVGAEAVEDPAAERRAERHAEARHHRGGAEHRAEDALPEVLAQARRRAASRRH